MSSQKTKDDILNYLMTQNRPYSANDICQHLGKDVSKSSVQKALDDLSTEEWIIEKTYGKQKVYGPKQYEESNSDTLLTDLAVKINDATSELTKAEQELKITENDVKRLEGQMSLADAVNLERDLQTAVNSLEEKLKMLSENGVQFSEGDKKKITKDNDLAVKEYKKRKRICMDIANSILENYPKPKRVFYEEVGIEMDN